MAFYKALDLEAAGKYREAAPLFRIGAAHVGGDQRAARTRARVRRARMVRLARRAARHADRGEPARGNVSAPFSCARCRRRIGRTRPATRVRGVDSRHARRARRRIASTRDCCCSENQSAAADSVLLRARQSARHDEGSSARARADARRAGAMDRVGASVARGASSRRTIWSRPRRTRSRRRHRRRAAQIREIFLALPVEVPSRRALADLETSWGSPADGWNALKDLPAGQRRRAEAWSEFAKRAEGEDRWMHRARTRSSPRFAGSARRSSRFAPATAAMNCRRRRRRAAPRADRATRTGDSALVARDVSAAARARARRRSAGPPRPSGWSTRTTDFSRPARTTRSRARSRGGGFARATWRARAPRSPPPASKATRATPPAGSRSMREISSRRAALLRGGTESSPELASALGLIARLKVDSAPAIGRAFLALARGDSAGAAAQFVVRRRAKRRRCDRCCSCSRRRFKRR